MPAAKRKNIFKEQQLKMVAGMVIRVLRETKGMSQEQLSEKTGLERTSITNIENGNQGTTLPILFALANAFDCRVSRIVDQIEKLAVMLPKS